MGGGRGESLSRGIDAVRPRYGARNASTLRPDGLRRPSHGALMQYKYVVLTNTTIGTFMALLDSNIVLISLPTIIRDLPGTTTIEGIWIILGYVLVTASLLLTIGRLADLYGRVRRFLRGRPHDDVRADRS